MPEMNAKLERGILYHITHSSHMHSFHLGILNGFDESKLPFC
jgi:hypothetical protein